MTMPTPEERPGEAFAEASAEAMQTSLMAFRLVMAIADAVRRQQQKRAGKEDEIPDAEKASAEASEEVKKFLPDDIATALLEGADWPQLAQQLMALKRAGVDLETMLPRVCEITVTVRDRSGRELEKETSHIFGTASDPVFEDYVNCRVLIGYHDERDTVAVICKLD